MPSPPLPFFLIKRGAKKGDCDLRVLWRAMRWSGSFKCLCNKSSLKKKREWLYIFPQRHVFRQIDRYWSMMLVHDAGWCCCWLMPKLERIKIRTMQNGVIANTSGGQNRRTKKLIVIAKIDEWWWLEVQVIWIGNSVVMESQKGHAGHASYLGLMMLWYDIHLVRRMGGTHTIVLKRETLVLSARVWPVSWAALLLQKNMFSFFSSFSWFHRRFPFPCSHFEISTLSPNHGSMERALPKSKRSFT